MVVVRMTGVGTWQAQQWAANRSPGHGRPRICRKARHQFNRVPGQAVVSMMRAAAQRPIAPGNLAESFAPLGPVDSGGFFLRLGTVIEAAGR